MRSIKIIISLHSQSFRKMIMNFLHITLCFVLLISKAGVKNDHSETMFISQRVKRMTLLSPRMQWEKKAFRSALKTPVLLYKWHLWDLCRVVNIRSVLYTKTFLVTERKINFARPFHWLFFSLWMSNASTPPKCSAICALWHDILC